MCWCRGLPVGDAVRRRQALAVPRQSPTIHRDSYVAFTRTQPRSNGGALERGRACPPIHYELCDKVIQRQES